VKYKIMLTAELDFEAPDRAAAEKFAQEQAQCLRDYSELDPQALDTVTVLHVQEIADV
jgi:hypothetical protein